MGTAEVVAYSDKAIVTLVVASKAKSLSEALKSNSATRGNLTNALINAGVDPDMIKNTEFSSSPHYGLFAKKPNNYEVVNRLAVTILNETQLQKVSSISDSQDETTIGSVDFLHSTKKASEVQAKEQAIDHALSSAKAYGTRLGLKMKPISFEFVNIQSRQSKSSMVIEEVVVTAARRSGSSDRYSRPDPVSFDEVKYEASVNITFEVEH